MLHFSAGQIVLDAQEAWYVLDFFFGQIGGRNSADLTENDISFAQALIIEAIDRSYLVRFRRREIGRVEAPVWSEIIITEIVRAVLIKTNGSWNWAAVATSLLKYPKVHSLARKSLSHSFGWVWQNRVSTGKLAY
ncbi:MAG: hypothetical protein R2747_00810 [Pyrinomonadaceae bacterium]